MFRPFKNVETEKLMKIDKIVGVIEFVAGGLEVICCGASIGTGAKAVKLKKMAAGEPAKIVDVFSSEII